MRTSRTIQHIFYLFASLLFYFSLSGCAEDKGSYEYSDINEITIGGMADEYHVIALRAPEPAITPQLTFTQYQTCDLAYSWQVDSKEICDHPSLDVPIEVVEGDHNAMLIITNNETTLKYYYPFKLHVETQFAYGVALLSEREDGTSDLGFVPMTSDGIYNEPLTNVFEKLNPDWGKLGTKPVGMTLRLPGEYTTNPGYYILNGGAEKVFVMLDVNTMEMKRAYSQAQIPGSPTTWDARQICDNGAYCGMLVNGKIYTFDINSCDQIAEPSSNDYNIGWFDLGAHVAGYCWPGYDEKSHQFISISQQTGHNFTFDGIIPFNEMTGSTQTGSVYLTGLTLVAGERMYNDGGFQYNNGMWGSWGRVRGTGDETDASTQRLIFRDATGHGHFYTYDYELGAFYNMVYELEIKAFNSDYGVREDRVINDITFNDNTVCKALPYGRYWLIANERDIVREFYADGAQRYSFTLPTEVKGNVVAMMPNKAETTLYVATYDTSSTEEYKGGVAVFSLDVNGGTFGNLLQYFPNICGKTHKIIVRE